MAKALSTLGQGSTSFIDVPDWTRPTTGTWAFRCVFAIHSFAANSQIAGRSGSTSGSIRVLPDGALVYRDNSINHISSAVGAVELDTIYELLLTYDTATDIYELHLNGELIGSVVYATNSVVFAPCDQLGRYSTTSATPITIYEAEFTGGTYTDGWDETTATGAGTGWVSAGGTRSLTIVNATGEADSWWVDYTTGPAENPQHHTTGGTLTAVSAATATTTATNKQIIETSATALAVITAQAQTEAVNAQNRSTSGNLNAIATSIATTAAANKQNIVTSATGIHIFTGYADTSAVNDTDTVQNHATGGTLVSIGTASATTSAANKQHKTTGGTLITIFTGTAGTSWVNQLPQLAALVYELKTRTRFTQNIETSGRHAHQVKTKTRYQYDIKTRSGG